MKKKRKYRHDPNYPIGKLTPVPDFLPPPEELFPPDEKLKVTIELDCESVKFFKSQAERHGSKYQRMMREVLRRYARHHTKRAA
jgi:BrnA antitoxin of type II toxin-antitoxin system